MRKSQNLLTLFLKNGKVSTDTRTISPGDIFFGLKGDRFDGNAFTTKALEAGAAYAVIDNPDYYDEADERMILVKNSLRSLQDLARDYRSRLSIPILGITGSNGKTTTKELIHACLITEKKVFATRGNLNNHIGVPLSLLSIPEETEIAIIEMGTNQPGDIAELVDIAKPTHALITNIGRAHLERLGSLEGVRREKGVLFDHVKKHSGYLFLNQSDPQLIEAAGKYDQITSYGTTGSDYYFELASRSLVEMRLNIFSKNWNNPLLVHANLSGSHNAMNILAAIVVGDYFGISKPSMQTGIHSYRATNNRSQIIERKGYSIWLDAYNANPDSMRASISNIFQSAGKTALILGDMLELGDESQQHHNELADFAAKFDPEIIIGIGEMMKKALSRSKGNCYCFSNVSELLAQLPELIKDVDWVLIKGSRGMALEQLLQKI